MAKCRVLVVDDAPYIRELLGHILSRGEYEIAGEAANGQEAIEKTKELKPDLVLMDIVMPIKSGVQAATEILKDFPKTKVVMMSTIDQDVMSVKALETGAHDLIHKPFKGAEILNIIDKVMANG